MSELDPYARDEALVREMESRIDKANARLEEMMKRWAAIDIEAKAGEDDDVVLTVNKQGKLQTLSFADGTTVRHTHLSLEDLINAALQHATKRAIEQSAAIGDSIDTDAFLKAFDEGLNDLQLD